jgi:hypothetical protein
VIRCLVFKKRKSEDRCGENRQTLWWLEAGAATELCYSRMSRGHPNQPGPTRPTRPTKTSASVPCSLCQHLLSLSLQNWLLPSFT